MYHQQKILNAESLKKNCVPPAGMKATQSNYRRGCLYSVVVGIPTCQVKRTRNRPLFSFASVHRSNVRFTWSSSSSPNRLHVSSGIFALSTFQLFSIISHKFLKPILFRITRNKDNPFMKKNNSFWKKLVYLFQQMKRVPLERKHIPLKARNLQC